MSDTAAHTVGEKSRAAVTALGDAGEEFLDSLDSVFDATVKRGKKSKKAAQKRVARDLKQARRQLRKATNRGTGQSGAKRTTSLVVAAAVVTGSVALLLQRRKAKAVPPMRPEPVSPTEARDPDAILSRQADRSGRA
jgi:ElaB/YqjD/DUF883 family membrane-anchored ribosome-binding protein